VPSSPETLQPRERPSPESRPGPENGPGSGAEASQPVELAVVVPAFDEEAGIRAALDEVRGALDQAGIRYELVVVDDGSSDRTAEVAREAGVRVIAQGTNQGYGAAIRAGVLATRSEFVAITDADGTYPGERLPELLAIARSMDMVVGARDKASTAIPLVRRAPKRFLTWLAAYLAGRSIPDLNSGLRVVRRSALERFLPILPSGFSFTTTITLAMLCTHHRVQYVPIEYRERVGSSKIRPFDFFRFVILVLRAILLFNPLKVFLPAGAVLFVGGLAKFAYDIYLWNLSESAVMAILAAVILWAVGSLADMIARLQLGSVGRG